MPHTAKVGGMRINMAGVARRLLCLLPLSVFLSGTSAHSDQSRSSRFAGEAASDGFVVTARGPDDKTWVKVHFAPDQVGELQSMTNCIIEVGTGMHYWADGVWKESQEIIELVSESSAEAMRGPLKVQIPANLTAAGGITFISPSDKTFQLEPIGLFYRDQKADKTVRIASLVDVAGDLQQPNRIIWNDAFDNVRAAIRFIYNKGAVELDVILQEIPAVMPEDLGLDPATTSLELWTVWQ